MNTPAYLSQLRALLGDDRVLSSPEDRLLYSYDATPLTAHRPVAAVMPRHRDDIAAVLRLANDAGFGVVPRGSGSGLSAGSVPGDNCVVLLLNHFRNVLELDEENLTLAVEPGVITAEVHQLVEARGLFYPPDPGSMNICTIGGNVAENSGGLRGLKYGVTRHYVMGLEVVLPSGEVVQTGGKCVKDVAGYNLTDVLVGSEGTLGVVTRALLRLIPKPETSKTMLASYDSMDDAARTVSEIIAARVIPCTLEFLDGLTIQCVEDYARIGLPTDLDALLLIEVDGRPAVVEEDAERVATICRRCGAREVRTAASAQEALQLKAARRTAFSALARRRPTCILEDATVPRAAVAEMVRRCREIAAAAKLEMGIFGHAGDGNLHPTVLLDERNADEVDRAHHAIQEIFDAALSLGGSVTGEHGVGLVKQPFLERQVGSAGLDFMRRLRAVLDPNHVLNPGKIFSGPRIQEDPLPAVRENIPARPWSPGATLRNDGVPVAP